MWMRTGPRILSLEWNEKIVRLRRMHDKVLSWTACHEA